MFSRFSTYLLGLSATFWVGLKKKLIPHGSQEFVENCFEISQDVELWIAGRLFLGGAINVVASVMNHLQPCYVAAPSCGWWKLHRWWAKSSIIRFVLFGPVGLKRTFYGGVPHLLGLLWLHLRCGYGSDLKITSNGLSGSSGLCSIIILDSSILIYIHLSYVLICFVCFYPLDPSGKLTYS